MNSKLTIRVILLFSIVMLSACQTSPTGRKQIILIPDAEMASMGAASFAAMKDKLPQTENTAYKAYVECLSLPLLRAAGEDPSTWEVRVFEDPSPNAFALPGKKIGVHTGMLKVAKTPGQLAAVIGHEIGHVQAKHGSERVSLNKVSQVGQQAAAILVNGTEYAAPTMAAIGLGAQFGVLLPYSRAHESEADYIGVKIMAKAGFDPTQSIALWENMGRLGGKKPPEFMSTHPSGTTRIKDLQKAMSEAKGLYALARQSGLKPNCPQP